MKRAHAIPMTSGGEFDALTRWRHFLHWKPGTRNNQTGQSDLTFRNDSDPIGMV